MMRIALLGLAATLLAAAAPTAPIVGTEPALRLLLAASSLPIPPSSSCHGVIPGVPKPTLGDVLATPLAALDGGTNRVSGGCTRGQCYVRITHTAGEDVFSAEFRFHAARGRLVPASLRCVSTP